MSLAKLALYQLNPFKTKKWFDKNFDRMGEFIVDALTRGNAITSGGVADPGATGVSATTLNTDVTAFNCKLDGQLKATGTSLSDTDVLAAAAKPIFSDGSLAEGGSDITLANDEDAYITLVAVNGDGAGAVTGEDGAVAVVAVVAGIAGAYSGLGGPLTDVEIDRALAASAGVGGWEATTGWARLADVYWSNPGGTPASDYTVNRDA
jgi:hypothetical protein